MKQKDLDFFKIPEGIRIPYLGGKIYDYISNIKRKQIQELELTNFKLNTESRKEKIIVSLTTFPARIDAASYAIKSLFNQTLKPDKIILWLAKEQFCDFQFPDILQALCDRGMEIRFCEDLKAHKKYYYALKNQKRNELVITYDDDIIYPEDSIEQLYQKHLFFPDCIICNRAQLSSEENGRLTSYSTWKVNSSVGVDNPSMKLFPSTGGGTLYPYGSVNEEAFNIKIIKEIAFSADDLWMRFMSALNGTPIIKTKKNHRTFTTIEKLQTESLQTLNCLGGENDRTIERLSKRYPKALKTILGEK